MKPTGQRKKQNRSRNNPDFCPMPDFQQLFDAFGSLKAGVIGDVMLDTYMWGQVDRISPEAPVPVISLNKREFRIGGAGNVALNCRSLGAEVSIFSVIGNDDNGKRLKELFDQNGIRSSYLVEDNKRITTNKTRIISRNQQMMRLDEEITADLEPASAALLAERIADYISREKPHVLIFEDYNKGVLTDELIRHVVTLCKQAGIITAVDPKRRNFFSYKNVDIFKPNLKEVKEALNLPGDEAGITFLKKVHDSLFRELNHHISFITLSDKGVFYQEGEKLAVFPSHLRNIADVSGAGDTVIAVASLIYAATKDAALMAQVANIAGGLVCEEAGTVAIDKDRLLKECTALLA